jgi:hypothetical protein
MNLSHVVVSFNYCVHRSAYNIPYSESSELLTIYLLRSAYYIPYSESSELLTIYPLRSPIGLVTAYTHMTTMIAEGRGLKIDTQVQS